MRTAPYVLMALTLIVFGYLALLTVGVVFALTGILMLVLFRWRRRPDVLAPALAWPWVFVLGFALLAPIACVRSATAISGVEAVYGSTRCSALFFTYAGGPHYEPPLLPALLASAVLATAASLVIRWALRRRRPDDRRSIGPGVAASRD